MGGKVARLLALAGFGTFLATTPPAVSPIHALFIESASATHYTVTAQEPNGGGQLTYQWRLIPPTADPGCNHFSATGNTAVWQHGDQDGCNHQVQVSQGHPGTVIVTISDGAFICSATYFGTNSGIGPAPACSPVNRSIPSATAAPSAQSGFESQGAPAWQIFVAIAVFLAVTGGLGWFLLSRRPGR